MDTPRKATAAAVTPGKDSKKKKAAGSPASSSSGVVGKQPTDGEQPETPTKNDSPYARRGDAQSVEKPRDGSSSPAPKAARAVKKPGL